MEKTMATFSIDELHIKAVVEDLLLADSESGFLLLLVLLHLAKVDTVDVATHIFPEFTVDVLPDILSADEPVGKAVAYHDIQALAGQRGSARNAGDECNAQGRCQKQG